MDIIIKTAIGLLIPFLGTAIGAGMVLPIKGTISPFIQKLMLGFSSGVMISASIWSLLIPAIDMTYEINEIIWLPAAVGFIAGICFMLLLDVIVRSIKINTNKPVMLIIAVTLHNIPEGMAVGVLFASVIEAKAGICMAGAFALSLGIALQNIPEGAIISMPLVGSGVKKATAYKCGILSGVVEPISALLTILLTGLILPVLPYILAFAAGTMMYVVVDELIPEAQSGEQSNIGTIGAAVGFLLMMILDVALG